MFKIQDWAGNEMNFGSFESFDEADDYLCMKLDDSYEDERGEYVISGTESIKSLMNSVFCD